MISEKKFSPQPVINFKCRGKKCSFASTTTDEAGELQLEPFLFEILIMMMATHIENFISMEPEPFYWTIIGI